MNYQAKTNNFKSIRRRNKKNIKKLESKSRGYNNW